ncbi:MobC family replication-relaxation protein [Leclercia adecarboxylata]|uniref:MobC family replication-relaxation protein n=1 Tax=Leclercia adecarboxylata TaxID=83655 RepID=UPI0027CFB4B6|nr:MobC family replication-relaxation protein [Leclercia adecarboxylata]MDQ2131566.1 MobC family replication-relaxation protein [Leclercia adecarboxylata]MDV7060179.1 MobC family replication-relaxation protein [Leclercia adecarboxylata]
MLISDPKLRHEAAERKRSVILRFLRDEIWSSANILAVVADLRSPQAIHKTLTQLERDGMLRRHRFPIAGRVHLTVWGITPHGLAYAWESGEQYEDRPRFEPSKLVLARIPHQTEMQEARLKAEASGWTDWLRGERLGLRQAIRPDALAVSPKGLKVAIELERTIKTRQRYQVIMREHLMAVRAGRWQVVVYISPDGMAQRLKRVFDAISYVSVGGMHEVLNDRQRNLFRFIALSDWPHMERAV